MPGGRNQKNTEQSSVGKSMCWVLLSIPGRPLGLQAPGFSTYFVGPGVGEDDMAVVTDNSEVELVCPGAAGMSCTVRKALLLV